ncbi:hypothetical protein DesfrDRAFT_0848 [Solidesulfovibrio fructosivorans JJ]]|uniref:Uncharacterized protein n=1 Tax=Solidesulfovibrio fructosivorans JJ] TaxID=596151 RepID=E1JT99_SOLFR|nr:hypothetical protein [Solidesulfovibrio fructosivorans]EFL52359.1 hypothetical protein DesfrDRAFT_0848 [Solidesulfovibrio fructosivorans JJ]]
MNNNILYVLCLMAFHFIIIVALFLYSIYLNESDDEMKKMIVRAKLVNTLEDKRMFFVLEKSTFAFCFIFIFPIFSLFFFCMLLSHDYKFLKELLGWFAFLCMTVGSLISFSDYFLSMIVIDGRCVYIRCLKTLFRPVVVQFDGAQRYESVNTGPYSWYSTRYMVSVRSNSKSFVFMNVKNKKQLRDVLESFGAA